MKLRRLALVGAGQMGSSHARTIRDSALADLAVVIDVDAEAAKRVAEMYGALASTELGDAVDCAGAIVAGSTAARMDCVLPLLEAGVPLLVEKPFAPTLAELDQLLDVARRSQVAVMCGFVERFNAAFRTVLQLIDEVPTHVLAIRHSPAAPRITSSVVNDLMLHDLDIAQRLFGAVDGSLIGSACVHPATSDWNEIADCTIAFGQGGIATLSANRMGQRKIRSLSIHTAGKLVEVDLLRQDVTVYRNVSQEMLHSTTGIGYRSSTEVELPFVRHQGEPLALQLAHFVDLIDGVADADEERRQIRPAHLLAEQIEAASRR
ncbi:MAG: Gfo/Idh/MocA family oxidoreductase [Actinobacteria bacterium]|nr:Gfo/Idh/MocA family oxidoreductase [Actinomycetota bacterium]